ncbi:MAG: hypothetical protein K0S55_218 [Clostridia bacterium]|nr:hypothetical protein [Clostridia bacterium]
MARMNDVNLEDLLQGSLKNETIPSAELNMNLKRALRLKTRTKTVSLWYLPLAAAILISICISSFVMLLISSVIIHVLVLGSLLLSLISISILTYIGVKKFELKEGAIIEI